MERRVAQPRQNRAASVRPITTLSTAHSSRHQPPKRRKTTPALVQVVGFVCVHLASISSRSGVTPIGHHSVFHHDAAIDTRINGNRSKIRKIEMRRVRKLKRYNIRINSDSVTRKRRHPISRIHRADLAEVCLCLSTRSASWIQHRIFPPRTPFHLFPLDESSLDLRSELGAGFPESSRDWQSLTLEGFAMALGPRFPHRCCCAAQITHHLV